MIQNIESITQAIMVDDANAVYTQNGIAPLFWTPYTTRLLIIGQAPGIKAQESGRFFLDRSGDRLREWMGVSKEVFYESGLIGVMPMDFYYPGKGKSGDLPPRKGFAQRWHAPLLAMMPEVSLILLVGKYAQDYYLGTKRYATLTETVAHYEEYLPRYFPIVHPSPLNQRWLKQNPWFEATVVPDLQQHIQPLLKGESLWNLQDKEITIQQTETFQQSVH